MNFYFGIFFVAVFLRGVVAEDPFCLVEVLDEVNPSRFFSKPDSVCKKFKDTSELLESKIKSCTYQKVDVSKLKSLHEDFCNVDSYFSREFEKNRECFMEKMSQTATCYGRWLNDPESAARECSNSTAETAKCMNKGVSEDCGDSSLEVYKRMTDAQVPLWTAICVQKNGAEGKSLVTWIILLAAIIAVTWHQY